MFAVLDKSFEINRCGGYAPNRKQMNSCRIEQTLFFRVKQELCFIQLSDLFCDLELSCL